MSNTLRRFTEVVPLGESLPGGAAIDRSGRGGGLETVPQGSSLNRSFPFCPMTAGRRQLWGLAMFHGFPEPRPLAEAASPLKSVRTALREVILTSN